MKFLGLHKNNRHPVKKYVTDYPIFSLSVADYDSSQQNVNTEDCIAIFYVSSSYIQFSTLDNFDAFSFLLKYIFRFKVRKFFNFCIFCNVYLQYVHWQSQCSRENKHCTQLLPASGRLCLLYITSVCLIPRINRGDGFKTTLCLRFGTRKKCVRNVLTLLTALSL